MQADRHAGRQADRQAGRQADAATEGIDLLWTCLESLAKKVLQIGQRPCTNALGAALEA